LKLDQVDVESRVLQVSRLKRGLSRTQPLRADELRATSAWRKKRARMKSTLRTAPAFNSLVLLVVCPLCSQFQTKLQPQTAVAFESYVNTVERQLARRCDGEEAFLALANSPDVQKKLLRGEIVIQAAAPPNPKELPDGLIHDWLGAVFIPGTTPERVIALLEDYDKHSQIYPEVIRSRLIKRDGDDLVGYWRVERKQQFVPAVFDVNQDTHYKQVAPGKWIGRSYAKDIREVEDAGTAREKDMPAGEGLGLLWRLYSYWSLQSAGNGVLAECRTVSLSRGIPGGMGWVIKPFVQNVPRESLASTLRNTRNAAQ